MLSTQSKLLRMACEVAHKDSLLNMPTLSPLKTPPCLIPSPPCHVPGQLHFFMLLCLIHDVPSATH